MRAAKLLVPILGSILFASGCSHNSSSSQRQVAAARDDGGSDGGGGGTFLHCQTKAQETFYSFWDLGTSCPQVDKWKSSGDQIKLSPRGKLHGGEWINGKKLKSYGLLMKRVKNWKKWAPKFYALMLESQKRDFSILFTDLSLQKLSEIQVAPGYEKSVVVPGAYFDYQSGVLFVDLKVWNLASQEDRAALLLHELLRREQKRFQFSNITIQYNVRRAIRVNPHWSWAEVLKYDHLTCSMISDSFFSAERDRGITPFSPSPKSAQELIAWAKEQGILGATPLLAKPLTVGNFSEPVRRTDTNREIEILGTCLDSRPDEDY